ncbi:MAG: hypothetical protein ACQET4_06155, partial [Pseudomonadota bacterium]
MSHVMTLDMRVRLPLSGVSANMKDKNTRTESKATPVVNKSNAMTVETVTPPRRFRGRPRGRDLPPVALAA